MSAPEYVPRPAAEHPRVYESPPRRLGSWTNDRPGDFNGRQPTGPGLGSPGPDQGYVLKLAHGFEGQLWLAEGEHEEDAVHGCIAVALKRASLFGRAPVIHDLTVAFSVWGFLAEPPTELLTLRRSLFEEVRHPHHYLNKRLIADAVPESTLRLTPAQVQQQVATDWSSLVVEPSAVDADSLAVVDDLSAADLAVPAPPSEPPVVIPPAPAVSDAPFATADITELAAQATDMVRAEAAAAEAAAAEAPVAESIVETPPPPSPPVGVPEPPVAEPAAQAVATPAPEPPPEPAPEPEAAPTPAPAPVAEKLPPPPTTTPASAMTTADITELAAEAKRTLRDAPTAPGGPIGGADAAPAPAAEPDEEPEPEDVPEVAEEPEARKGAKPVAIPKDADADEVQRLIAEAKQAFRRKPKPQD